MAEITGTSGNDALVGTTGDDTIHGGAGNDSLDGNGGNDSLFGDEDDDFITVNLRATVDGGAGIDTLKLIGPGLPDNVGYRIDLRGAGVGGLTDFSIAQWQAIGIENVSGGSGGDIFFGSNGANILAGEEGYDLLFGGGGDDLLLGDGSLRYVNGQLVVTETGVGADGNELYGGDGNDRLVAGDGGDILSGQAGDDRLEGGDGVDLLFGGLGDDFLDGGAGFDTASYSHSDPAIGGVTVSLAAPGTPINTGGYGIDILVNIENLVGSIFSDSLTGNDQANYLFGGAPGDVNGSPSANNDTLSGLGGKDFVEAAFGNHSLDGGTGNDTLGFNDGLGVFPEMGRVYDPVTLSLALQGGAQASGMGSWTLSGFENLSGWFGNDVLTGDENANVLAGSGASDTLTGGGGNDVLLGDGQYMVSGGQVVLYENVPYIPLGGFVFIEGNDILDGGEGDDRMVGGRHNDIYYVDSLGDVVVEEASQGTDEVRTGLASYTLAANVENLTGLSSAGQTLIGNDLANVITAGSGNDFLDGGIGADTLRGGVGNDIYLVDDNGDAVTELAGEGSDEIRTSLASYNLAAAANVENLTGTSAGGQTLTGNDVANLISGGAGNDTIDGLGESDILAGGSGGDNIQGGAGDDNIYSGQVSPDFVYPQVNSAGPFPLLDTGAEVDTLSGGAGSDVFFAGYGDNVDGGTEEDSLNISFQGATAGVHANFLELAAGGSTTIGGGTITGVEHVLWIEGSEYDDDITAFGNDRFAPIYGRGGNDHIEGDHGTGIIYGGDGNDVIDRTFGGFSFASYGDSGDDTIIGGGLGENIYGGDGNDSLSGNGGSDRLEGGIGNDFLDGGAASDTMIGGTGDDIYVVNLVAGMQIGQPGDSVTELAGEGTDQIRTGLASYSMAAVANVENLTGTGSAGQTLTGNNLDNIIDGGLGADTMIGGAGNDIYLIDNAGDSMTELAGEGTDEARTALASYSIAAMANVEKLTGTGSADQNLTGNGEANIIDGGLGADTMIGGLGDDVYFIDNGGDVVTELAGEGTDEIRTALTTFSLGSIANVENLTATSDAAHDFTGNGGDNRLAGAGGNDFLRLQGGGNDTGLGGSGNDSLYYGAAFAAGDSNDGGAGDRDILILQGNYAMTLDSDALTGIEFLSLQSGSRTSFGDTAGNSYDYALTLIDGNVGAGQLLTINAQSLLAGEDLTFDGSAETNGRFLIYAGRGVDTLTGGAGGDIFYFEGLRWSPGDTIDGGGGRDSVVITGAVSGMNDITIADDQFDNVESISVNGRFATDPSVVPSYHLVVGDHNASNGALILNAASLASNQQVTIDASAVTDGALQMFGGAGLDHLIGGALGDTILGGFGEDLLTGGGGNDIFRYDNVGESTATGRDGIMDFSTGDKVDLSRIDAISGTGANDAFTFIGSGAFTGAAGELRAVNTSGNSWTLSGDVNGDGLADVEIVLVSSDHPITGGDFVL
jgi:serralysin